MKLSNDYWIKSGLLNILQNFSGVFFGFGSFYFLIRILTKEEFGTWSLFLTVTTIQEIVRSSLVQSALIKFVSGATPQEKPKILSAAFTISLLMTAFCIAFNSLFSQSLSLLWHAPAFAEILNWYNLVFLITGFLTLFNCLEQAELSFKGVFWSNFIRQISFFLPVCTAFLFHIDFDLKHLVYIQIVGAFVSTLVSYTHIKSYLVLSWKLEREWIKRIFNYGKYAFGTSVSAILSGSIDQMMLGSIISPKASGEFNIAVRITNLVEIPTSAIAAIVFPQSSKRMETEGKEAVKYLYEKSVGAILAILLPCLIIIFFCAGFVVNLIAGDKYEEAIPLLQITILYSLFTPFGRQFGTILDSIGKTRLTFSIVIFTACLNALLNYIFISEIGILGAAYATLISQTVGFIIGQRILYKELNVSILNVFRLMFGFYPYLYNRLFYNSKK